jgi:hypothetical protein
LVFGHHRLASAIAVKGKKFEMTVQIVDYDDDEMIRGLADENHGKSESTAAKLDVIRLVRKRLIEDSSRCKRQGGAQRQAVKPGGHAQGCEHGGSACISAYLSANGKIWSERRGRVVKDCAVFIGDTEHSVLVANFRNQFTVDGPESHHFDSCFSL